MTLQSAAAVTDVAQHIVAARRPVIVLLTVAGLFFLAAAARLEGIEQHLTADDQDWVLRIVRFGRALERHDLAGTYQSGHPGVTVLWLASVAFGRERNAELASNSADLFRLERSPAYLPALFDARRALALCAAALIALIAVLAWRLLGSGPALLGGLLLANEPFLVAHGRLLHTDPLLALLLTLSILAALAYFLGRGGGGLIIGSGLAAGLAMLTKAPGVFLLGFVPLLGFELTLQRRGRLDRDGLVGLGLAMLLWGGVAVAAIALLWPALWADPFGTLQRAAQAVRGVGESPRRWGNFFLGQVVAGDAGPLFYPVVTALRLSPLTLIGLLFLPLGALGRWRLGREERATAWALTAGLALFTLMMTLSPKKLDRYLLAAYPLLDVLAGLGWWQALRRLIPGRTLYRAVVGGLIGLGQAILVAGVQPYPLSYFNPLLGGIGVARQVMIVGWGEGTDQVAAFLDRQPGAEREVAVSLYNDSIQPLYRGRALPLWEWQRADYLADYVNMDQRNLVPAPLWSLVRSEPPLFSVWINGLEYARVWRIPPELRGSGGPDSGSRGAPVPRP